LWRIEGTISRGTYALAGFIGFAIKHNLDRLIASSLGTRWGIWNYWIPLENVTQPHAWQPGDRRLLMALLVTALPFIWIGVTLTVKRLRDAGQPLWLAILFFAPIVNLLFFAVLCVLSGESREARSGQYERMRASSNLWPESRVGSAVLGVGVSALIGVVVTWIDLRLLGNYGLTLFIALPFVMGYVAVWIHCHRVKRTIGDALAVATLSVLLAAIGIAAIAIEGIICLFMAAPIAWILAAFGGFLAHVIHNGTESPDPEASTFTALVLAIPLMLGAEHAAPPPIPRFQVHTSLEIAAPPAVVWKRIISFPTLPPPGEWPFRLGIAYPVEAHLTGEGLTADRECRFSTGRFKEPILVWEPGKHFAFAISEEPLLMKETSPYGNIRVRHLEDHDFQAERADFFLTSLPNGGTRLEGISTYQNRMWPGSYWRIWTDAIVHSIHQRVFEQVKTLAEADARALPAATATN
jgi:MFS family permease